MHKPPYSFDDLFWFVRIAEAGGLSRSARQFDIAKSTLSRMLGRLEADVGTALMHRNSRAFALTESGQHLLEQAGPLFRQLDDITREHISEGSVQRGLVRMSASGSFGKLVLLPVIMAFMGDHPGISVELELTDRRVRVIEQGVDIAVRIGDLEDSRLISRKLVAVRRILCASIEYVELHGAPSSPEQLTEHSCLFQSRKSSTITLVKGIETKTVALNCRLTLAPSDLLIVPVQMGLGISPLPEIQVGSLLKEKKLVRILPDWSMPALDVHMLYPSQKYLPPAVRLLMEYLISQIPNKVAVLVDLS